MIIKLLSLDTFLNRSSFQHKINILKKWKYVSHRTFFCRFPLIFFPKTACYTLKNFIIKFIIIIVIVIVIAIVTVVWVVHSWAATKHSWKEQSQNIYTDDMVEKACNTCQVQCTVQQNSWKSSLLWLDKCD